MASYTLNAVLLNLIGSLLTAQPYLEVREHQYRKAVRTRSLR
jgi:hypothetical protein